MFDIVKQRVNPNSDNPTLLPGYHPAPSNPDTENLKYYRGALAAGAGATTATPHVFELFGAPLNYGLAVGIRPYRARNAQTQFAPYFYPDQMGGHVG